MRAILLLPLLGACDLLKEVGDDSSTLLTEEGEVVTESGVATVEVDIDSVETAFMITADGEHLVSVDEIIDPAGNTVLTWSDWTSTNTNLTSAIYPSSSEMVLNWPVRAEDAKVKSGKWKVVLSAVNSAGRYQSGSTIKVTVQTKDDSDFLNGTVRVRLVYAEGVGEIAAVRDAMEAGIERWKDIWAPYGLTPAVTTETSDFDPNLPYPGEGSEDIYDLVMDSYEDELTMIVGETIRGGTDYLGVAGAIPGTLTANTRSAVVVSWLASAGTDGVFQDTDITILGETMAHEVGHYMGLFHPVEQTWSTWDACDDTPDCTSESACVSALGSNLMFPTPVCDFDGCIEQDQLSLVQEGILHRYTGTL